MPHDDPLPPTRRTVLTAAAGAAALTSCAAARATAGRPDGRTSDEVAELDEVLADLTDQQHLVAPITRDERTARRKRLGKVLTAFGYDALLCEHGATMKYLSGVEWGHSERLFGLIVTADGGHFWIVPSFEEPKARLRIDRQAEGAVEAGPGGEVFTWHEHEYAWRPLAAALREHRVKRIAIDPFARLFIHHGLESAEGGPAVGSGAAIVKELRGRKDKHELQILRTANELTQRAITAVAENLQPGMTGRQFGLMSKRAQERLGLSNVWVLPLIGEAAAYPHGEHDTIPLERGDVVLLDTGGTFHEYESDITRTWVFDGTPTARVDRVWHVVRDAQARAFEAMQPGVACKAIDDVARAVIERAGFGSGYETFSHRLGHGIGMEGHEEPYLDGGNQLPLAPGMTFSDEPGIYLYGEFGVRLEDIVVVTEDGADHFGAWQTSPTWPS